MPVAGLTATVKASGASVVMTGEAHTSLGGNAYQITNTAKRIVDPAVTLVVKENGVASVQAWTYNYLFGIVQFPGAATTPITVDGAYLPVAAIAESRAFDLGLTANLIDTTSFDSSGAKRHLLSLLDSTLKLTRISMFDDIDPVTGGLQTVESRFAAKTSYLIELGLGGVNVWRGWLVSQGVGVSAAFDGIVTETVDFVGNPPKGGANWAFNI